MGQENTSSDRYPHFAALDAAETAGRDYRIEVQRRPRSGIAVIAPHGGSIEHTTSALARAIAGDDLNLYLFEGLDPDGSFETLHITSHRFDEPRCLELVACCDIVVAVHGASDPGHALYLGGRDEEMIAALSRDVDHPAVDLHVGDHPYPGRHRHNICNRGRRRRGVQIEFSDGLRGSDAAFDVATAIRTVLLQCG